MMNVRFKNKEGIVICGLIDTGCTSDLFHADVTGYINVLSAELVSLQTAHGAPSVREAVRGTAKAVFPTKLLHGGANTVLDRKITTMANVGQYLFSVGEAIHKQGFHMHFTAYTGAAQLYQQLFDKSRVNVIDILPDKRKTSWTTVFAIGRTVAGAESALNEYMKCEDALTVCRAILPDVTRADVCVDEMHNGCKILQVFFSQLDTPYN